MIKDNRRIEKREKIVLQLPRIFASKLKIFDEKLFSIDNLTPKVFENLVHGVVLRDVRSRWSLAIQIYYHIEAVYSWLQSTSLLTNTRRQARCWERKCVWQTYGTLHWNWGFFLFYLARQCLNFCCFSRILPVILSELGCYWPKFARYVKCPSKIFIIVVVQNGNYNGFFAKNSVIIRSPHHLG